MTRRAEGGAESRLYTLQAILPHRTRSALHRCITRHGISRLPNIEGNKPATKKFTQYPIRYVHLDMAMVRMEERKLFLFVSLNRVCTFAYAELCEEASQVVAAQFLRNLIAAAPYKIHTVLTDNGIQFTNRKRDQFAFAHIFDRVCQEYDINHRLTRINYPWTNGQVERMSRTLSKKPP